MPIGPYPDWDACIRAVTGKVDDPEAYCGALERDASMWIVADVVFDSDTEAREAERLAREGKLAGVSVDLGNVTSEIEVLDEDEDGFPVDWLETLTEGEILGATQVAMPAFADAHIEIQDGQLVAYLAPEGITTSDKRLIAPNALTWRENAPLMFNDSSDGHAGAVHVGNLVNFRRVGAVLVASSDPNLAGLMKPMVRDGKIVGHGAGWGTCHTAIPGACVTPPSSTYSHVKDGVKIYRHPRGDVHAPLGMSLDEAKRWYDAHCELVGRAGVGEDDHGIWINGESSLDNGDVFLSGDWRNDNGELELISFLVVANPGFPTAMVASDTQQALTSAGIVRESDTLVKRIERLEAVLFTPEQDSDPVESERIWSGLDDYFETESLTEAFSA